MGVVWGCIKFVSSVSAVHSVVYIDILVLGVGLGELKPYAPYTSIFKSGFHTVGHQL